MTCFRFYTQMWVENNNKAFAYRVPIGDYNYLQCILRGHSYRKEIPRLISEGPILSHNRFPEQTNEHRIHSFAS